MIFSVILIERLRFSTDYNDSMNHPAKMEMDDKYHK